MIGYSGVPVNRKKFCIKQEAAHAGFLGLEHHYSRLSSSCIESFILFPDDGCSGTGAYINIDVFVP